MLRWFSKDQAIFIHDTTIKKHGGLLGIRDEGLLESALMRPENLYIYGEKDIFNLASYYAESIMQNHPFIDGNKRTGYILADLFLFNNGFDFQVVDVQYQASIFEDFAAGKMKRQEISDFYRKNSIFIS